MAWQVFDTSRVEISDNDHHAAGRRTGTFQWRQCHEAPQFRWSGACSSNMSIGGCLAEACCGRKESTRVSAYRCGRSFPTIPESFRPSIHPRATPWCRQTAFPGRHRSWLQNGRGLFAGPACYWEGNLPAKRHGQLAFLLEATSSRMHGNGCPGPDCASRDHRQGSTGSGAT